ASLVLALVVSIPFIVQIYKMETQVTPFRFLELPQELRDIVYEHLIEDPSPSYPPTMTSPVKPLSSLSWILPQRPTPRSSNWTMLTSRQVYQEYMDVLCRKGRFTFTVDQDNHTKRNLWPIRAETLSSVRKCDLRLIATSKMLGAVDPRSVPQGWPLRDKICETLAGVEKAEDLNLHVRAIGDPLWNPLWVWFHASQAFKDSGRLCFNRITFSLDECFPGQNHLGRNNEGHWCWQCPSNHEVAADPEQCTVRDFCSALYAECEEC
ncbi:hypothetical protein BU16DRAFT_438963, partial [Lophium mytilinum]